jgi:hypothetical protein
VATWRKIYGKNVENYFKLLGFSNEVLVVTHFNKARYQRAPPCSVVFKPRLKEFLEICVLQFHVYI